MAPPIKDQKDILKKLNISALNPMQLDVQNTLLRHKELILLSPTGTGKTLAFLLPIVEKLKPIHNEIQVLIIVPTRELAVQIETVLREMGTGHKVNAIYGGRSNFQDKMDLKQMPSILVGTPGRLTDHIRRRTFDTSTIKTLVLDEFDKSLEIGFAEEMELILGNLGSLDSKILCSATELSTLPDFVEMNEAKKLNCLKGTSEYMTINFHIPVSLEG